MINIEKHVTHWKSSAIEDWDVAISLIERSRTRHGLFFLHLALEKALKAHVCKHTRTLAPRIHNLVRLAELSQLVLSPEQLRLLGRANAFNLIGRYPDALQPEPSRQLADEVVQQTEELFEWLIERL